MNFTNNNLNKKVKSQLWNSSLSQYTKNNSEYEEVSKKNIKPTPKSSMLIDSGVMIYAPDYEEDYNLDKIIYKNVQDKNYTNQLRTTGDFPSSQLSTRIVLPRISISTVANIEGNLNLGSTLVFNNSEYNYKFIPTTSTLSILSNSETLFGIDKQSNLTFKFGENIDLINEVNKITLETKNIPNGFLIKTPISQLELSDKLVFSSIVNDQLVENLNISGGNRVLTIDQLNISNPNSLQINSLQLGLGYIYSDSNTVFYKPLPPLNEFVTNNDIDANGFKIVNLANPSFDFDASNKLYVDTQLQNLLTTQSTQNLNLNNYRIVNLSAPINSGDAINKSYLENSINQISNINSSLNMNNNVIYNLNFPTQPNHATNKEYVDTSIYNLNTINAYLNMQNNKIYNLPIPVNDDEAANKKYIDDSIYNFNKLNNMLDMGSNRIFNLDTPIYDYDASNKLYTDNSIKAISEINNTVNLKNNRLINSPDPINNNDVVNKLYVDLSISAINQLTDTLNMNDNNITNLKNPINNSDAANKNYVDQALLSYTVSDISTDVNFNNFRILNLAAPINSTDSTNKNYVDTQIYNIAGLNNNINLNNNILFNLSAPINAGDATNKAYVDNKINTLNNIGSTLNMNFNKIINVLDPLDLKDATTKEYVDSSIFEINQFNFPIDCLNNTITNLPLPINSTDAANKDYVDTVVNSISNLNNNINLHDYKIFNSADPDNPQDVVNKRYLENVLLGFSNIYGPLNLNNNIITNVNPPINLKDASNKEYVDNLVNNYSPLQINNNLNLNTFKINNLGTPINIKDAATKEYVDQINTTIQSQINSSNSNISTLQSYFTSSKLKLSNLSDNSLVNEQALLSSSGNVYYGTVSLATSITSGLLPLNKINATGLNPLTMLTGDGKWISFNKFGNNQIYVDTYTGLDTNDGSFLYPFKTIQAALAFATNNYVIYIAAGVYTEYVSIDKSNLLILGTPSKNKVLCSKINGNVVIASTVTNIYIENIFVENLSPTIQHAVTINSPSGHYFYNCTFSCSSPNGNPLVLKGNNSSGLYFYDCIIIGNAVIDLASSPLVTTSVNFIGENQFISSLEISSTNTSLFYIKGGKCGRVNYFGGSFTSQNTLYDSSGSLDFNFGTSFSSSNDIVSLYNCSFLRNNSRSTLKKFGISSKYSILDCAYDPSTSTFDGVNLNTEIGLALNSKIFLSYATEGLIAKEIVISFLNLGVQNSKSFSSISSGSTSGAVCNLGIRDCIAIYTDQSLPTNALVHFVDSSNICRSFIRQSDGNLVVFCSKTSKDSIRKKDPLNQKKMYLDRILNLGIYSYIHKKKENINDNIHYEHEKNIVSTGVLSEEFYRIFKFTGTKPKYHENFICRDKENCEICKSTETGAINYNELLCYFILAFQEYNHKKENEIKELKTEIENLNDRLKKLESLLIK